MSEYVGPKQPGSDVSNIMDTVERCKTSPRSQAEYPATEPYEVYKNYEGGLEIVDGEGRSVLSDTYAYDADEAARIKRMEWIADALTKAGPTYQQRVQPWLLEAFGKMIAGDKEERNHRFLEEALELVQACNCTAHEAHQLVDYVFGRPVGDKPQEVGGVMVTLAALCLAQSMDMHEAGEIELARIWTKIPQIRAKQASKPKCSPLPE